MNAIGLLGQLAIGVVNAVFEPTENQEDKIKKNAIRADSYFQRWILLNNTTIYFFQSSDRHLRISIKYPDGKLELNRSILEPQSSQSHMCRRIEHFKSLTPRITNDAIRFDFSAPPIQEWYLGYEQVKGIPFGLLHSGKRTTLDPGTLSLIIDEGVLTWRFYANKSRTFSFLNEIMKSTFVPNDRKYQSLEELYKEENADHSNQVAENLFKKDLEHYDIAFVDAYVENDYEATIRDGKYYQFICRASQIFSIYLSTRTYASCVDPKKKITRDEWSVTLISVQPEKGPPHAEILFEKLTVNGVVYQIAHLTAGSNSCSNGRHKKKCNKEGKPQLNIVTYEQLSWANKSKTWVRPAQKIRALINKIDGNSHKIVPFHIAGNDSILTAFSSESCHNCITWAREQIKDLNINLPSQISDVFYVHPDQYSKKP